MENEQNVPVYNEAQANAEGQHIMTNDEVLSEILENTRKTKNYMKWQLYITIALVVLPLLAMVAVVPMLMSSIGNMYGSVLQ